MKRLNKKYFWCLNIFLLLGFSQLPAATYYVDGQAPNDNGTGSASSPKKYIQSGIALMTSPGDVLVIEDGVYTGHYNNIVYNAQLPVSGNASAGYSVIKARHPGRVTIDGEYQRPVVDLRNRDSIHFDGLIFKKSSANVFQVWGFDNTEKRVHIKVTRCGFSESGSTYSEPRCDLLQFDYVSYGLIEDCYAWGTGRYHFYILRSDHIILRRCVDRFDRAIADAAASNMASYRIYDSQYCQLQNCIAVDGDQPSYYYTNSTPNGDPQMFFVDGANGVSSNRIIGCIGVNNTGMRIYFQDKDSN